MKKIKLPPSGFIAHVITWLSIAVIVLTGILLLAQNRDIAQKVKAQSDTIQRLAEQNGKLSREIKAQNDVIKEQTDINQRYLRCILLITADQFKDVTKRVAAIDECSKTSKLPNGQEVGNQPTTGDATNKSNPQIQSPAQQRNTPTPQSSAPQQSTPTAKAPTPVPTETPPSPQPSVVQQITKPIKDLLGGLL